MAQPYLVTGLKDNSVFPRLEIRDLQKNTKQFTLFIHSLVSIMLPEHRPKASRFSDIGGIHGLPYERWIGDPNDGDNLPDGTFGGYCNHGSVLFPVWHRPYLLALEQSIGEMAVRHARSWTKDFPAEQADWENAAKELRLPYWDWTDSRTETEGLPDILHPQTFTFSLPGGRKSDPIDNPLACYNFGVLPDGFKDFTWNTSFAPDATSLFKDWRRTYRWPSSKENPLEDYIKIKQLLAGNEKQRGIREQLRGQVAKLFTYPIAVDDDDQKPSIWDEFSNTTFQSKNNTKWKPINSGSLESIHNTVHLVVGGLGYMAHPDYAAFDPIFYLHHCNIDRLLSFWEYVYPDYWMGEGYINKEGKLVPFTQADGTWDENDDAKIKQTTLLKPFRKGDGQYWDPLSTRFLYGESTLQKGYTYPAIDGVSLDKVSPSIADRNRYIKILQTHFGLDISPPTPTGPDVPTQHPIFSNPAPEGTLPDGMTANYRTFAVEVELVGHAFNGSYFLQLVYKEEVVGSFAVFSRGDDTRCAACKVRREAGGQVHGFIEIPMDIIYTITADAGLNKPESTTSEVIEVLRNEVSLRLVAPSGILLAEAIDEVSNSGRASLGDEIVPKLGILSAAAAYPTTAKEDPIQFLGLEHHGDILRDSHKWKTG